MSDDRKLGEILIANGWITRIQLDEVLDLQREDGRIIGKILIEKGYLSMRDLYRGLSIQYGLPFVDLDTIKVTQRALQLIPKRIAFAHKFIPLFVREDYFLIAISDPNDVWVEGEIRKFVPSFEIRSGIAPPEDIKAALEKYYGPEGVDRHPSRP